MSAHVFTEDQLVEQPAIGLFAELGWTTTAESHGDVTEFALAASGRIAF